MEKQTIRTVLITGCSDGGLGAALAIAFHKTKSFRVLATARTLSKMSRLRVLGIETLELDVLLDYSVNNCVEKVSAMTDGKLDVLINNAGGAYNGAITDVSPDDLRSQLEVNVLSAVRVTQAFFPLIQKSTAKTRVIVNNTSAAPALCLPFYGPYTASKAALSALTETLRVEMQPFDIKVVDLKTGGVKTHFYENATSQIPDTSAYHIGKDIAEKFMRSGVAVEPVESEIWAGKVVRELSKRSPPRQIWLGKGGTGAWFLTNFVPKTWVDGRVRKYSGLAEIEERIRSVKVNKAKEETATTEQGRVAEMLRETGQQE
jgi:1-acylglycerone phosphate reductase